MASLKSLQEIAKEAAHCKACPLWQHATQTVFGEGEPKADLMLIGEQPGDQEDIQGDPFVGPAGKLLHACIQEAGMDEMRIYLTNAVKHFKWEPAGHRRLHKKPNKSETDACRPWLQAEIEALKPKGILCLGSTAAQSLLGSGVKVTQIRGRVLELELDAIVMATVHPSSLLRMPDQQRRHEERELFIQDLKTFDRAVSV
ncbi:MAG TPA: UdgX family uracil-DNA binding protein [Fimbriimonadaceae bacterium]|jgi:DNA polymerase